MNWYIGQKVVYIGPDKDFDPNPGKTVHTIIGIRGAICKCGGVELNVGKLSTSNLWMCQDCNTYGFEDKQAYWKNAESFRPLIDDHTDEELESVNIDELLEPLLEPA